MQTTIIYYTANVIPDSFHKKIQENILTVKGDLPLISVSQKPMDLGHNILVDLPRSHFNIYRQALIGAKEATTPYIAMAEDDVLYSPDHFKHIPKPGIFEYNKNVWSLYTWTKPIFSSKDRRVLHSMICERELFIQAMEERFKKYPDPSDSLRSIWAEPSKYESQLKVSVQKSGWFDTVIPNIAFSHPTGLSYAGLGKRKKLGILQTEVLPYWGTATEIKNYYV